MASFFAYLPAFTFLGYWEDKEMIIISRSIYTAVTVLPFRIIGQLLSVIKFNLCFVKCTSRKKQAAHETSSLRIRMAFSNGCDLFESKTCFAHAIKFYNAIK